MPSELHCFALHVTALSHQPLTKKQHLRITDHALIHRIKQVLRLQEGDRIILFDASQHVSAHIHSISQYELVCIVEEFHTTVPLYPSVTWWLPLLKREAFEEAVYVLAALGVTVIQPIRTQKTARSWGSPKDYSRVQALMIAACEQAKQFYLPKINPVKDLQECVAQEGTLTILFDPRGEKIGSVLSKELGRATTLIACSGPEGDFVAGEKAFLEAQGFTKCSLTPTILKAEHAVTVGMGIIRSW